jgi:hypothetical protein
MQAAPLFTEMHTYAALRSPQRSPSASRRAIAARQTASSSGARPAMRSRSSLTASRSTLLAQPRLVSVLLEPGAELVRQVDAHVHAPPTVPGELGRAASKTRLREEQGFGVGRPPARDSDDGSRSHFVRGRVACSFLSRSCARARSPSRRHRIESSDCARATDELRASVRS